MWESWCLQYSNETQSSHGHFTIPAKETDSSLSPAIHIYQCWLLWHSNSIKKKKAASFVKIWHHVDYHVNTWINTLFGNWEFAVTFGAHGCRLCSLTSYFIFPQRRRRASLFLGQRYHFYFVRCVVFSILWLLSPCVCVLHFPATILNRVTSQTTKEEEMTCRLENECLDMVDRLVLIFKKCRLKSVTAVI